jgi:hypothetical protein
LLIILTAIYGIVSTGIDTAQNTEYAKAKVLADSVSRTVNTVYTDGAGNYIVYNFTNTPDFNYTVNVTSSGVSVQYNGKSSTSSIIPTNNLQNSITAYPGDIYNVSNNNGSVAFTKISI